MKVKCAAAPADQVSAGVQKRSVADGRACTRSPIARLGRASRTRRAQAELSGDGLGRVVRNERLGQRPEMLRKAAGSGPSRAPSVEGSAGVREIRDGFGGRGMTSWREMSPS